MDEWSMPHIESVMVPVNVRSAALRNEAAAMISVGVVLIARG